MKQDEVEYELGDEGKSYVQIDKDLRILMSPRNWQLQKRLIAQTDTKHQVKGEENWVSFKWYMNLDSAIKDIIHIKTAKETFKDMAGLVEANKKVIKQLTKAFGMEYTLVIKETK